MDKENISREITEEQRQEFIQFARDQGYNVSDNIQLKSVDITDILTEIDGEKTAQ